MWYEKKNMNQQIKTDIPLESHLNVEKCFNFQVR